MRLSHRFAIENDLVTADCVEATEFPDLANRYGVYAVPKTVINQGSFVEGALPEEFFLNGILKAVEPQAGADEASKQ